MSVGVRCIRQGLIGSQSGTRLHLHQWSHLLHIRSTIGIHNLKPVAKHYQTPADMTSISASYRICPPAGTPSVSIPPSGEHVVNVNVNADQATAQDDPRPVNAEDSPYYSALLASLASAKEQLNADLTIWKEAIGDREKQKEAVPAAHKGKQGLGKAMMMVKAAKENDALPDDDDDDDDEDEDDEAVQEED